MSSISNNLSNIIKEEVRLVNNWRQVNHLGTEKKKKGESTYPVTKNYNVKDISNTWKACDRILDEDCAHTNHTYGRCVYKWKDLECSKSDGNIINYILALFSKICFLVTFERKYYFKS